MTFLLAVLVRATWTIRIGKRSLRISALALMLAVNALAILYLGTTAWANSQSCLDENDQIDSIRQMLASERKIAHAGGQVTGADGEVYKYTNCLEAFSRCIEDGVHFVELDFRLTTDKEIVCIHNWRKDFVKSDGTMAESAVSLEEFRQGRIRGGFTPMTMEDVASALQSHGDVYIVLDLKGSGEEVKEGYRLMAQEYPDLIPQLIPQFYHVSEYESLYALGYRAMIYTLYKTEEWERSEDALNEFAMRVRLVGITMGKRRALDDSFLSQVLGTGQPVYANTVDSPARQQKLYDRGVSAVYTNVVP
jgi:glycerophosphoryl diester phosphodiesterase